MASSNSAASHFAPGQASTNRRWSTWRPTRFTSTGPMPITDNPSCSNWSAPTVGYFSVSTIWPSAPSASSTQTRTELCQVVLQHLTTFPNCGAWLRAHRGRSSLSDVMSSLFPLPVTATPEEVILHLPRCMIGGFTKRECTAASRRLGFLPPRDGCLVLDQLRLICLRFLSSHYQSLKPLLHGRAH